MDMSEILITLFCINLPFFFVSAIFVMASHPSKRVKNTLWNVVAHIGVFFWFYLDMFGTLCDVFGKDNVTWAIVWLISVATAYKMGKDHRARR